MMDRISGLTDKLLLHVLSFLQTKDAVATSLLSKRWRPLWRSLRKLDFDDTSFRSLEFFHQFVDAALHLVHLESVQSFVLKCVLFSVSPVKVNIWVNALFSYKLTYLELHFSKGYIRLPSGVFNCNSICVLKLRGLIVGILSTVNLPSLKVLHLKMVRFSNSECVKKLLSKCVHVEELVLKLLDIPDVDSTLNIPRFKHLLSAHVPASLFPMKVFSNVQFLILCEGKWYPPDDIPIFHNLTHLEIRSFARIIVNWLQNFPKLQSLVILNCGYDSEDKRLMEPTPHQVPPCVSYHLKEFALIGFIGSEREFEIVKSIMEKARVLKTVVVGSAVTCERERFEMLIKLSSYRRRSPNCRLFYYVSGLGEEMRNFFTFSSVSMYLQGL